MRKKKRIRKRDWGSVSPWKGRHRARAGDEDRTSLGIFDTEDLANAALDEARLFHRSIAKAKGPGATLVGFGRAWLERVEREGEREGVARERSRFETHVATADFAPWPIESITQRDVHRWIRDVARKLAVGPRGDGIRKVSRGTVLNVLNLLRSILRTAIEDEIIDVSPAAGVVVKREKRTTEPWTWLSMEEIDRVLALDRVSLRSRTAIVLAIFSGMRPGEMWGLHWGDVLFDTMEIVVRHSRDRATKTGRVRRIPMLEPAAEWLARWRDSHRRERVPGELVFPGRDRIHHDEGHDVGWAGKRERVRAAASRAQEKDGEKLYVQRKGVRERLELNRNVRFYDLRHTCASHLVNGRWWVERGWISAPLRLEDVQHMLGHLSRDTTERYAHFAPGGLVDIARPRVLVGPKDDA